MLVLTRKVGQSIIIDDDIVVKVLGDTHGQIKIGIDAPEEVPIHWEEVFKRIKGKVVRCYPIQIHSSCKFRNEMT